MPFMIFAEDKYVNDELFAPKNTQVNVDDASVDRWLARGGQLVNELGETDDYVSVPAQETFPMTANVISVTDGPPNVLEPATMIEDVVAPASPVVRRGPGRPKKF